MLKIKYKDLITIKRILGDLYLENGNSEEVVLLSQAINRILLSMQVDNNNTIKQFNTI
ncbi:hypothetical protein P5F33_09955 [Clostridium perfringens]|uniref:hypothetical protein n=1 Tax=Clostridium perfringens TaxID=1502 RepID=UPI001A26AB59|nr:hypothetical protein [Clostridium perfringens]MBO3404519.1 hypothetical protein [Clostridium perfringens]MDK0875785.1 hypothetical protein [Clostridium perfringens]HAT4214893.1 hypothetical protein [Clostridium perfringens]